MRISPEQITAIRQFTLELAGPTARVWLFGSRVHDHLRGGDVDLLLELDAPVAEPALLAAQLSARVSRSMDGRKVDVLIKAPNVQQLPIHSIALEQGICL